MEKSQEIMATAFRIFNIIDALKSLLFAQLLLLMQHFNQSILQPLSDVICENKRNLFRESKMDKPTHCVNNSNDTKKRFKCPNNTGQC